jgi:hypothetical protein
MQSHVEDEEFIVEVEGKVHLGERLDLELVQPPRDDLSSDPDYVEGSRLPPHERTPLLSPAADRSKRADFVYRLKPSGDGLFMADGGLTLQYGILGGPGSGKTNLLIYMLRQVISHCADRRDPMRFDPSRKFGGIILDPKAALIEHVRRVFKEAGREDDLVVLNSRELVRAGGVNVIDCMLAPRDLAKILVLAAQSGGVGARDPYWFQQMTSALGAIMTLFELVEKRKPGLADVISTAVGTVEVDVEVRGQKVKRREPALNVFIRKAEEELKPKPDAVSELTSARIRLEELCRHAAADPKGRVTVEQFIEQAFGLFREPDYACYSVPGASGRTNFYDDIIDEGKVVLVSAGAQELTLSSILPSLVKLIYQRTVLSRFERFHKWELHNRERPLLFLADEYHTVATQIEGERVGDSEYFSMARQMGGLCLVATQTVQQLKNSGLKDTWEGVFGTLAAVIGMKGEDADTIAYLQKRGGKKEVLQMTQGFSVAKEITVTENTQWVEVPKIPEDALKQFRKGDAVIIGSITGQEAAASISYLKVPRAWPRRRNGEERPDA